MTFCLWAIILFHFSADATEIISETPKVVKMSRFKGYRKTVIPQYEIPAFLSREDMNKIIPKDVTPADDSQYVLRKMSDRAVQVWLKSSSMQNVPAVQAAQKVENAMKAEIPLGSSNENQTLQHKLNFQVLAFQTTSKVNYKGYVDATLSYNLRDKKTNLELREKILKNKDLFVNHTKSSDEDLSSVGLRWSF